MTFFVQLNYTITQMKSLMETVVTETSLGAAGKNLSFSLWTLEWKMTRGVKQFFFFNSVHVRNHIYIKKLLTPTSVSP